MHRFLVLCFALLLPLQFVWAGAAAYCEHEDSTARAAHVGHHAHVHEADDGQKADGKFVAHADCAACHATGSMLSDRDAGAHALPMPAVHAAQAAVLPIASALARAPDRPQWLRLA